MNGKPWTEKENETLRRLYPHQSTAKVSRAMRRSIYSIHGQASKLGLHKTQEYLDSPEACRLRRGDKIGLPFRFPEGHVPANKGLRRPGWTAGRMRETQFRKGERSGVAESLWKPVGTERISKDGYLERKVNDGMPLQRRWRSVHLIMWEAANGPLPAGHAVAFKNSDKRDIRLENLELITRGELMRRNSIHNFPFELKDTMLLVGRVKRAIRKRIKNDGEKSA